MDGQPLILGLDTSSPWATLALCAGGPAEGEVIAELTFRPGKAHGRSILARLDQLMAGAGRDWQDLDGLAVGTGPGSFTGLRIAMATAQGLAMALDLPLVGVGTAEALALGAAHSDLPLWVVMDARRGQVYAALFKASTSGPPRILSGPRNLDPSDLAREIGHRPVLLAGDGALLYREVFAALPGARILPAVLAHPRAACIAQLGALALARGETLPADAGPCYVRRFQPG